jgi:hypothetical protein
VVAVFGLLVRGLVGCEELVVLEFGITCGDRDSKWIAHHQILCHAACTEYEARHVAERRLGCLSTRLITSSCSMFVASRHARLPFRRLANPMNLSTKQHTHTHDGESQSVIGGCIDAAIVIDCWRHYTFRRRISLRIVNAKLLPMLAMLSPHSSISSSVVGSKNGS